MKRLKDIQNTKTKYHFKDTIDRHSQGSILLQHKLKKLVPPGRWETSIEEKVIDGAIVSLTTSDLQSDLAGHYTNNTRKLYCYELIAAHDTIIYTNNAGEKISYSILRREDKSDYDDNLNIYYIEGVTHD